MLIHLRINHRLINTIDERLYHDVVEIVNNIKIRRRLEPEFIANPNDFAKIQDVIGIYELAIVDLWKHASSTPSENIEEKNDFRKICNYCFNLLQALPIPDEPVEQIKHVLKLLTYAYLGEKWEDMKRFLLENDRIWESYNENETNWDLRLFSTIYIAILHLVRKTSWDDLDKATKFILKLRNEQMIFEEKFIKNIDETYQRGAALEIASLYHLAKSVDLLSNYMMQGNPPEIIDLLDYHFDAAIDCCQSAKIIELDILLRMLKATFKKMVTNSIWNVTGRINSRVNKFVHLVTHAEPAKKPMFELLYPQRVAILEQRLLDPALKAIVVNLPTSSGKTIIAEFRILQALNQFNEIDGKIVYVVPTKALVNQTSAKLRRDLGPNPLNVKVEKMSGALEIDSFEENILTANKFQILVTTPEKLNLLIRHPNKKRFTESLVLVIIDEAHNISNKTRGLNLEMLISNIQKDCKLANLLLLTPFIRNHKEVAKWLDPTNPQSISIDLDWWQPNDKVVGMYYAEGKASNLTTMFQPLVTFSNSSLELKNKIKLGESTNKKYKLSTVQSKSKLTSLVASQLWKDQNILILAYTTDNAWKIAKDIYETLPNETLDDEDIDLVSRYVSDELGETFPLVKYIKKGIGVHHGGLPDDIRELMEWLMEKKSLKILVATTTIAQGVNFPINGILMASYSLVKQGPMSAIDFWNLVGRAGRIDQRSLGFVGIAVNKKKIDEVENAKNFVQQQTEELASVLSEMTHDATRLGKELNLLEHTSEPEWSSFLQYISHMYQQSKNLEHFNSEINIILKRTFGFNQLEPSKKKVLVKAVELYAQNLDQNKELASISDITGFSPETVENAIEKVKELNISPEEWTSNRLFSGSSSTLAKLTGIMIEDIPEIKKELAEIKVSGTKITHDKLGRIISDWVSGMDLTDIASAHFGGNDTTSITKCVQAIYSKVTNSATWGLAAIQKLPGSNSLDENLTEKEKKSLRNLSAMIFYGVNSDEAILMRLNNVPRSIAPKMGEQYKNENPEFLNATSSNVVDWITHLNNDKWDSIIPVNKKLTGAEYKQIWKKLSGMS